MEKPFLKVKKIDSRAIVPSKRDEDGGYDIYGIFEDDYVILEPGRILSVPTGLSMEFPSNWIFFVGERGSTGTRGISRRCGVVDSGYRGELFIVLNNTSNKKIIFSSNEEGLDEFLDEDDLTEQDVVVYPQKKAIAQGMLLYCPHVDIEVVDELSKSKRGKGAVGSSGK